VLRFERHGFTSRDDVFYATAPLTDGDRFLTLVTTDGGDGPIHDYILWGDPVIDVAPRPAR
jgi:hypothetical protein